MRDKEGILVSGGRKKQMTYKIPPSFSLNYQFNKQTHTPANIRKRDRGTGSLSHQQLLISMPKSKKCIQKRGTVNLSPRPTLGLASVFLF